MADLETLSKIVEAIFETALEPHRWDDVCDLIADGMGGTAFMVFEYDLEHQNSPIFYSSEKLRGPDSIIVQAMHDGQIGAEDKAAYERFAAFEAGQLISEHEILGVDHDLNLPKNGFRDLVLEQAGSKSRNVGRLNDIGPWLDVAALHMPCFGVDVPQQTREEMRFLLPVIRKALEASRVFRTLARQYGMLLDVFDRLDFGLAFCTPAGRILATNKHMSDLLKDGDAVIESNGRLLAASPSSRKVLQQTLHSAGDPRTPPRDLWFHLSRRSKQRPMIAKAATVKSTDVTTTQGPMILLLLADPEDEARVHAEGLAAFGLLSPAEIDVCRWLLRGATTEEISERRDTTVATTRSQLKSVASKMQCQSRLDLLRIAVATSLPK